MSVCSVSKFVSLDLCVSVFLCLFLCDVMVGQNSAPVSLILGRFCCVSTLMDDKSRTNCFRSDKKEFIFLIGDYFFDQP